VSKSAVQADVCLCDAADPLQDLVALSEIRGVDGWALHGPNATAMDPQLVALSGPGASG
jgi:hypothetical protein